MPGTHLEIPEQETMGRTVVTVNLTNQMDSNLAARGSIDDSQVRQTSVQALVDAGAAMLCLPADVIAQLGLDKVGQKRVQTANGVANRAIYDGVWFEVMGRGMPSPVMENEQGTPALLGYIPLEVVDLRVNPKEQRLEGNPDHGGEWVIDML